MVESGGVGMPPVAPGWEGRWEQGSCDWGRKETQGVEGKPQSSHGSGHGVWGAFWERDKGEAGMRKSMIPNPMG